MAHGLSRYDALLHECLNQRAVNDAAPLPQMFGYLAGPNPITGNLSKETIVDGFDALIETMRTTEVADGKADAGMTFFGQFVDHDITLDATSAIGTVIDPRTIRNIRTPNLDLDCVYGDGPEASPFMYAHGGGMDGFLLFGREGSPYDLARNDHGRALIGDPRNDENIIVSQIQGAFIALHNILMTHAVDGGPFKHDVSECGQMGVRREIWADYVPEKMIGFEEVRRFIRLHYQWIILNEFLPSFVDPKVIHQALEHDPFHDKGPIMPAEFSVAAYRFGHATVQPSYKLKKDDQERVDLFKMQGFGPRGPESDIEMRMFFDVAGTRAQRALPVGVKMADTLFQLPDSVVTGTIDWNGFEVSEERAKKLALRNILRDRTAMQVQSGQAMARKLGLHVLDTPKALTDHHITKTPLWFYCLQEASEKGDGRLTGVGGSIVASVIIRLMKLDPDSVLNNPGFTPWSGFGDKCSMGDVMAFVEKHRDDVKNVKDLYTGPAQ